MTCKKVKLNKGAKKVVSAFQENCKCGKRDRKVEENPIWRAVDQIMNKIRGK